MKARAFVVGKKSKMATMLHSVWVRLKPSVALL